MNPTHVPLLLVSVFIVSLVRVNFFVSRSLSLSGGSSSSLSHASLAGLRGLLGVDVAALVLSLVAAVVVPATLSSVVVVTQDEGVRCRKVALRIFNV